MIFLPKPQRQEEKEGKFYVDYSGKIVLDTGCGMNCLLFAKQIQEDMRQWCGIEPDIIRGKAVQGDILLKLDESLKGKEDIPHRYLLTVSAQGICIAGSSEELLANGVQTLRQMIAQKGSVLPCIEIEDYPELLNRGFYHDVTRGRVLKLAELKKMADTMCYYKMNQLQLYVEHTYLFRGMSEVWRDETPLTAQEIMELDAYCSERHIDLVPSLSSFGHLYKMLRTYSYDEYCELENSAYQPYSFWKRMAHHTVNVSHDGTLELIKGMIEEYMSLFRSKYFNICADETFDLCKGRSSHMIQDREHTEVYTDYVTKLSEFLIEKGRIPMFWGDVLWNSPESIRDLPKENICLNWGYAPKQREDETRGVAEAGAVQYTCPGVCGWNEWVNLFENSYENISRMCTYAKKYKAIGVLNTDWGDFGHINQPEFSIPGLIYGAAFSWNSHIMEFEEINEAVSVLELNDPSGKLMSVLSKIAGKQSFGWREVVMFCEMALLSKPQEEQEKLFFEVPVEQTQDKIQELKKVRAQIQEAFAQIDSSKRGLLQKYLIGVDGIIIWNRIKPAVAKAVYGTQVEAEDANVLAEDLENWFMKYKEEWRKVGKEGDLGHISKIVFWYADLLRRSKR